LRIKLKSYAKLGVTYYIIYNPQYWRRDGHQPFEIYKLVNGIYCLQIGEPFWMPEVGLGIGRSLYVSGRVEREVLAWYDRENRRYPAPEEIAAIERQQRQLAEQQQEKLAAKLRELGIDPEQL
jgi:hypothetical protein